MKTILSCDHVFDTLTRGPFPAGAPDDDAVELHLAGCHECRRLAEALRPAAELWRESLSASEQETLPAYDGLLARLTQEVINEPTDLGAGHARLASPGTMEQVLRFGSAMLFGLSLCLVLVIATSGVVRVQPAPRPVAALPIVRTAYRPDADRLAALAGERLSAVCFPADWKPGAATAELACCSQCHAPGSTARGMCGQKWSHACKSCHQQQPEQTPAPRLFAVLQQSCSACHDS